MVSRYKELGRIHEDSEARIPAAITRKPREIIPNQPALTPGEEVAAGRLWSTRNLMAGSTDMVEPALFSAPCNCGGAVSSRVRLADPLDDGGGAAAVHEGRQSYACRRTIPRHPTRRRFPWSKSSPFDQHIWPHSLD